MRKPAGGMKQIRLTAVLLAELGVPTFLLRDQSYFAPGGGFDDNVYYGISVPEAEFSFQQAGARLGPEDVLVLPEMLLVETLPVCRGWKCRIALNNQNGFYALRYRPHTTAAARQIEFAIANAPYVAALCKDFLGVDEKRIFTVPHWIVRPPFGLREPEADRALAVCYMPRKLPGVVRAIRELVERSHPDVPWVEIDGLPEDQVALRFRANRIFFAAHETEGCPMPALEAMACGCLTAGFPGTAGFAHPYASPTNGIWAPDGDAPAAAEAVRLAIEVARTGGQRYEMYVAAGRETALRFAREPVREALAAMIEAVAARAYTARKTSVPSLAWKERLFAYRILYNHDRLGWPGRLFARASALTKPIRRAISWVLA